MDKKKKIILISVINVILVALIIGAIFIITNQQNKNDRVLNLYNSLNEKSQYNISMIIDENNKIDYSKKGDMAYIESIYKGDKSKYIIKGGNTYLLKDEDKKYYTYMNNETELTKITGALKALKETENISGIETIYNKDYYYEEYPGVTMLSIGISDNSDLENNKTIFYFDGDKLAYIKTITKDEKELMKIDISYKVKDNLFEIPSDYKEG